MGRVHFDCWGKSRIAELSAISSRDPEKLAGKWAGAEFNLGDQAPAHIDMTGITGHPTAEALFADPEIDLVDICSPTPLHAPLAISALRAGKHVFCEKPMALTLAECDAMEQAARESGKQLAIGHCLRYWPHYLRAKSMLESGEFGQPVYAEFFRTGAAPAWSAGGWLMREKESGGILDMHIHDIDVALWWFGQPKEINATGHAPGGLPMIVDAQWRYDGGLTAHLHSAWDRNGGAFRHAFRLIMEKATVSYDLASNPDSLMLFCEGKATALAMPAPDAYQAQLDDFAASLDTGRKATGATNAESRAAVEIGLSELQQFA